MTLEQAIAERGISELISRPIEELSVLWRADTAQSNLPLGDTTRTNENHRAKSSLSSGSAARAAQDDIDSWTDAVIRSDFNDVELGHLLNRCIDLTGSVDAAVAFSAIVAKAKLARKRRR